MRISLLHAFGLLLFSLSWLAYDHYRPWVNFHSETLAFWGLLGLALAIFKSARQSVSIPRVSLRVALIAVVPWLQFAFGINPFAGDALLSSLYLFGLFFATVTGFCFARAANGQFQNAVTGLMHSLWIAATASAGIGLAQWFGIQGKMGMYAVQTDIGDRAMGNLGQPNQFATLLLMGLLAYAYAYEQRVFGRFAFSLGVGLLTSALVMTQSRSGMLAVVVIIGFLVWKKPRVSHRVSTTMIFGWALCFLGASLLLPFLSEVLMLDGARDLVDSGNVTARWRMWQQIAYAVTQSPWVGYGWNQTPAAHAASAIAYPGLTTYTNAHNVVMDILAWTGLPLGLLIVGAIAYWFVSRVKSVVRTDAVYAMACLLAVAVHSMLEYPFAYSYFLIACGFMVGIVEAGLPERKTVSFKKSWAVGFLTIWTLVGGYMTYEYFLIEEDFRVVRFENLRIGRTPDEYEVPKVWMISHMAAMLKAARQVPEPDMAKKDLENLRNTSSRFAYGALRFRYAQALGLNGDPAGASKQLAIIRGMYGETYFNACVSELRRLQAEKYPQYAAIVIPP
jgi:O-antigen ligase